MTTVMKYVGGESYLAMLENLKDCLVNKGTHNGGRNKAEWGRVDVSRLRIDAG